MRGREIGTRSPLATKTRRALEAEPQVEAKSEIIDLLETEGAFILPLASELLLSRAKSLSYP